MYKPISTPTSHYSTYYSHSDTSNIGGTNHYRNGIPHPDKIIIDGCNNRLIVTNSFGCIFSVVVI